MKPLKLMLLGVGLGLIACTTNTFTGQIPTPDPVVQPLGAGQFSYGQHEPNGLAAVNYIYGPDGTWKALTHVKYIWNYYPQYATSNHPFNRTALINFANGSHQTTTRDANGHLLLDFNNNGELDVTSGGFAFHEHNAKGVGGATNGLPFTNFWFDDNWLARYMSNAYGTAAPTGLWQPTDFNRWSIMDGNTTNWTPYNSDYFDTLAFDGLYYLSSGNSSAAIAKWDRMLAKSGATYDAANQQDTYPNITENYHMGLFKILTEQLLLHAALNSDKRNELIQHAVHQRSAILSNQEYSGSTPIGWRTSITDPNSLINTETVSVAVLALGAAAKWTFEVGRLPMSSNNNNYFLRPYNVLSAVNSLSSAGHMAFGPYRNFPTGTYTADYLLRAPAPSGKMATVDVYDSNSGALLATRDVNASDFEAGNTWTKISLGFSTDNGNNSLEFRIYWYNTANMDAAYIQVR
jgi:hypothetical protein